MDPTTTTFVFPDGSSLVATTTGVWSPPPAPPRKPVALGLYTTNKAPAWRDDSASGQALLVGKAPQIIHRFQPWTGAAWAPFDAAWADDAVQLDCMPMISWEGRDLSVAQSAPQPAYSNLAVTRGDWDGTLIAWLKAANTWGGRFLLRVFHEGNGAWYSWAAGANGNTPGSFIDAWRHVARLVRQYAPAAQIVWCPGTSGSGWLPFEDVYPGSGYVDVAGLDFYNTSTLAGGWSGSWQEFSALRPYYDRAVALAPGKPVLIAEMGCAAQAGQDKAGWYLRIKDALASMPAIAGIVAFDQTYGALDFRVNADTAVAAAWHTLASDPLFQGHWRY